MPTYTPLQSIELISATNSVIFSNIPQTYQDLVLIVNSSQETNNTYSSYIQLNGDTGGNYSRTMLYGTGSAAGSARQSNNTSLYLGTWDTTQSSTDRLISIIHFNNYSNTTTYKTMFGRYNMASKEVGAGVGTWRSTSAITSIKLESGVGANNYASGSTFDLYGISPVAADTAQAFGGTEIIYTDTHVIHVFKGSGVFIPYRNLTVDYLVVAGGGSGGRALGGGGGAGGLRSTVTATGGGGSLESALSLTASTNYTVTIGGGGAGVSTDILGNAGSNSVFSTITSTGGGGGASYAMGGGNGGSGGGAGWDGTYAAGTGTTNQGYAGGKAYTDGVTYRKGGAGGGAGAVGATASGNNFIGANGGTGVATSISGSSVTYAGGGGGSINGTGTAGAGGSGGGGIGNSGELGVPGNGTTNTGGGGGACWSTTSGNGGSGIVIVRYAR